MRRFRFFIPKIVLGGVFVVFLFAPSAYAELYTPGETLDPACAPTDVDCGVQAPVETGTAGQFPYYSADGSVASATSTITLLSSGYFGVGTSSPYAQLSVGGNVVIGGKIAGGSLGDLFLPKLGAAAGTFLAVDANGKVIATSTPGLAAVLSGDNTFTGNETFSNIITGSITGNAGTATKLQTARTINGISFDGSADITIPFATSTLLGDDNTFSGTNTFLHPLIIGSGTGTTTVNGNIGITGNIVPSADNTYSLGSSAYQWKDVHIGPGSLYVNGKKVIEDISSTMTFSTDAGQNLSLTTSGIGSIETNANGSGNVNLTTGTGNINFTTTSGNINFLPGGNLNLGTVTSGIWHGTALTVAYGGTGSTTLSGILKGNGTGNVLSAIPGTDYQRPISLTTTGNSGAATFTNGVLNIPQYSGGGSSASSTLLADNNHFSGNDSFSTLPSLPLTAGYILRGSSSNIAQATSSLFIGNSGFVGIGTTSPTNKLEVNGNTVFYGTGSRVPLTLNAASGANNTLVLNHAGTYNAIQLNTNTGAEAGVIGFGNSAGDTALANSFYFLNNTGHVSSGSIRFVRYNGTSFSNDLTINASGNAGFGTTSPRTRAQVYGTLTVDPAGQSLNSYSEGIRVGSASNGYSIVTFGANPNAASGTQANQWYLGKDGTDSGFTVADGATKMLHVLTTGATGIGTTNPGSTLDVVRTTNGQGAIWNENLSTGGSAYTAYFAMGSTGTSDNLGMYKMGGSFTTSGLYQANDSAIVNNSAATRGRLLIVNAVSQPIIFATGGSAAANERMRIDSSGAVAIGSTNPYSSMLRIEKATSGGLGGSLFLTNSATAAVGNKTSLGFDLVGFDDADTTAKIDAMLTNTNGATDLAFYTYDGSGSIVNHYESMRITSSGKIGIGTTSPFAKLALQGTAGQTNPLFEIASSSQATRFLTVKGSNGYVGVATSSPYKTLSIGGDVFIGSSSAGGANGNLYLAGLATPAGAFLAVDATGKLIATTTPSGGGGGGAATAGPSFLVDKNGTNQTVTAGVATLLTWSNESFDTNNNFSSDRFQPTVAGKYIITGTVDASATASGQYVISMIYKNGSLATRNTAWSPSAGSIQATASVVLDMNGSTDYVELYGQTNLTAIQGTATLTNFSGALIAPIDAGGITNNGSVSYLTDTTDNFGIGTTSAFAKLDVYGNTLLEGSSRYLNFGTTTGSGGYGFRDNAGTLEFKNANGVWNGVTTATTGPSFMVNKNGTNQTVPSAATTKLTWTTKVFDTNNNFDLVNNWFKPTVPGKYLVTVMARCTNSSSYCAPAIYKNGALYAWVPINGSGGSGITTSLVDMNGTTDYVDARVYAVGTTISGLAAETQFSGTMIAPVSATGGGITNNGTASYLIDNTNKLGIGTSSPFAKLAIQGTSGQTNPLFEIASSSQATRFLTVKGSNGYVGIATSSPYKTLSVGGDVYIGASSAGGTAGDLYIQKLGIPAGSFLAVDGLGKVIATSSPAQTTSLNMAKMTRNTNQSLSTGVMTKINLNNIEYDSGGLADASTNFRINIQKTGKYLLQASWFPVYSANSTNVAWLSVYKNGAVLREARIQTSYAGQFYNNTLGVVDVVNLQAGDYLELYLEENTGTVNTGTVAGEVPQMSVTELTPTSGTGVNYFTQASGNTYLTSTSDNVLFGTTTNQHSAKIVVQQQNNNDILNLFGGASEVFTVAHNGNTGIASSTPWRTLSVAGTAAFSGLTGSSGAGSICLTSTKELVYNSGSDSCLPSLRATKHDITDLSLSATSTIEALNPVSFIYNNDTSSTTRYGFIAEDTAGIDPHLATYDAAGNLSGIDDRAMLAVVVKALKDILNTLGGYAQSMTTSVLNATTGNFTHVKTQDICVGSTCITETELKALLEKNGQASNTVIDNSSAPPIELASSTEPIASSTPPVATSTAPTTDASQATSTPIIIEDVSTTTPDSPSGNTDQSVSTSTPGISPVDIIENSPQPADTASTTPQ